MAVIQK